MNDLQNKIYKDLAQKLNKNPEVVERVCKSIFEFLAQTIREEEYQPYRIQGLGVFEVKEYIKKKAIVNKRKREEKELATELREERNREMFNNLPD